MTPIFKISCRVVGPGGTTVAFYPTSGGLKAIWSNENCPYSEADPSTDEAYDGSNVSIIPWAALSQLLSLAPGKVPALNPQPKKGGKKR